MTPWPVNKPLLPTTDIREVEGSMQVWEAASPSQLRACWEGALPNAAVLPATLDDRRLELLALRLAASYQTAWKNVSPQDVLGREVLTDVHGPYLSAASEEQGYKLSAGTWQMSHRDRYSHPRTRPKISPAAKLAELLAPLWVDAEGVSWLSMCGPAIYRRFNLGVAVELCSPQAALESVMTREHHVRRRAGELDAAWPQVAPKASAPRM